MIELCEMCEHYLTDHCSEERRVNMRNEVWDGFKVKIETCPDYKRVSIDHTNKEGS